uniref:Uncharacterized protein n=1 Tax=Opuntia streptacantha TaxID=393608 RepID=A0A7C9A9N1_OPUST
MDHYRQQVAKSAWAFIFAAQHETKPCTSDISLSSTAFSSKLNPEEFKNPGEWSKNAEWGTFIFSRTEARKNASWRFTFTFYGTSSANQISCPCVFCSSS